MSKLFRNYGVSLLLLLASALLGLVLVYEWFHFRTEQSQLGAQLAPAASTANIPTETSDAPVDLPPVDGYAQTISRPLFMEDRRPSDAVEVTTPVVPAEKAPLTVKLMGVVMTPEGQTGLFLDVQGKYKRARAQSTLSGWKVLEIRADRAVMEQAGEHQDLMLLKPKPKQAVPPKTGTAVVVKGPHGINMPAGNPPAAQTDPNADESDESSDDESAEDDSESDESIDEEQ